MMRLDTYERYEPMTGVELLNAGVMTADGSTEAVGLEYAVGLPESHAPLCLFDHVREHDDEPLSAFAPLPWPGAGDCPDDRQITPAHARLFHIDSSGHTCFTPKEAAKTIERLEEMRFIEQLRAAFIAAAPAFATPSISSSGEMTLVVVSLNGIVWLG